MWGEFQLCPRACSGSLVMPAHLERAKTGQSGLFPRRFVAAPTVSARSSPRKGRLESQRGWRSLRWCFSRRGSGYLAACGAAARVYRVICSPFVRQMFWGGHLGAPQPQNSSFHNFCQHRLTCKSPQLFSITPRLGSYRRCAACPGKDRKGKSDFPKKSF